MSNAQVHFLSEYVRAERALRATLLAMTGCPEAVDDLVQNVAVALWTKWADYDADRPFRSWALGVARIEALRWRRGQARDRMVLSEETVALLAETADGLAERADERRHALHDCLRKVADHVRAVLRLRYTEGLRAGEIAERLGRTVGAVEMTLTRSRRALRECIERQAGGGT